MQSELWLIATVVKSAPAAFAFSVQAPSKWIAEIVGSLRSHMETFDLATLYSVNAGSEMVAKRRTLKRLHKPGGREAVRERLSEEALSCEEGMP